MTNYKEILGIVIASVIGMILMATLLPVGLNQLYNVTWNANTPSAVLTIVQTVIPIMVGIGLLLAFLKFGGKI